MSDAWTYEQAMDWLNSRTNYEKKWPSYGAVTFSLERMSRLCALLGDPQDRYPAIHITGTKGKGSTAAMIESILRAGGLRTGLYTSPHLVNIEERMRVNAQDVPKERLAALLARVRRPVEYLRGTAVPPHPTFFEIFTAAAFLWFADEKVDWGVIEVGLGGRLDSTNVITPEASVVTRVGLDHMNVLGNTVMEIATEKAGIIKPGVPAVIAPQERDAERVLRGRAGSLGAPVWGVGREITVDAVARRENGFGYRFDVKTPFAEHASLEIPLLGAHQVENAAAAVGAIDVLRSRTGEACLAPAITEDAIASGLARVEAPARVEVMGTHPLVVVDGAHNPLSMGALVRAVRENFAPKRIVLLYAMAGDKDIRTSLDIVLPIVHEAFFTTTNSPRAAKPEVLAQFATARGLASVHAQRDTAGAFRQALAATAPGEMLLITGSLYLAGDLRPVIQQALAGR